MSAQRPSPETTPDLGAGDPKYVELERIVRFHRRVGGAPETCGVILLAAKLKNRWAREQLDRSPICSSS